MEEEKRVNLNNVYIASDNIISSLGFTTEENALALRSGLTGIRLHENEVISPSPFWASMINAGLLSEKFSQFAHPDEFTRFEKMIICSANNAIALSGVRPDDPKTIFILSTTKGNIDMLDNRIRNNFSTERAYLWHTARVLQQFYKLAHTPVVVSNACISGILAIIIGARMIRTGMFNHAVICGADLVTEFVLSGFNSFLSLCSGPCKPFDKDRQGLSLGEAAGTIVLTADKNSVSGNRIAVGHGFSSNDANHISGPSRTGEGLTIAIKQTLERNNRQVDYISAHGTATPYNDEMECIAINRAGLNKVPVNSLKGYWGHTLGAAGIIETIAGVHSLTHQRLFKTLGFSTPGVSLPLNVIDQNRELPLHTFLKIASGFGGSNASLLFYNDGK